MKKQLILVLGYLCLAWSFLNGQTTPLGLSQPSLVANTPTLTLDRPTIEKWQAEDETFPGTRFAAPLSVDWSPNTQGQWVELDDDTQLWLLKIQVPDARGLAVFYDNFRLPEGAQLFAYRPDGKQVLGPYSSNEATPAQTFWTGFTAGETLVLEYQAPAGTQHEPFHIWRLDVAYSDAAAAQSFLLTGFGSSDPCHDNINCSTGDDWQVEKTGVARIIVVVEEGSGFCTGTLLNNTAEDGRLLFLTAFHCMDGFTPQYDLWRFDFQYEADGCTTPGVEPSFQSIMGSTYRAGRQENDFILLELNPPTVDNLPLHFAGWDRSGMAPDSCGIIHHPLGDIQKIATTGNDAIIYPNTIPWDNDVITPANHHFRARYNNGIIEAGSSGAALFDKNHRVVGQLHGSTGNLVCNNTLGYFGRLALAWDGGGTTSTRLSDWLDPMGTDTLLIDALGSGVSTQVFNDQGEGVAQVRAVFSVDGMVMDTTYSDTTGVIPRPGNLPTSGVLTIELSKGGNYLTGVTTFDIVQAQKHIIGIDTLDTPYRILASDVNNSDALTTLDIIRIRKLILNIELDFGNGGMPNWQFYRADIPVADPVDPWGSLNFGQNIFTFNLSPGLILPNFIAVKSGDANGSASPQ